MEYQYNFTITKGHKSDKAKIFQLFGQGIQILIEFSFKPVWIGQLYHHLNIEMGSKTQLFLGGQCTHQKQNPKNQKLKVVQMEYQRVLYKDFGNYVFTTVESGLINLFIPSESESLK